MAGVSLCSSNEFATTRVEIVTEFPASWKQRRENFNADAGIVLTAAFTEVDSPAHVPDPVVGLAGIRAQTA
jgi:hypothetical protein